MSLALYRKYRPGSFAEVKGQEHVTGPLQQALRNGRIAHAYLFSGPRGCGKTSSARILARSLNCERGPTPEPCGVCPSCVALAPNGPGSLDVIEIDAASHNGVDDARDLRDKAFFAPVSGRFKVYIIDEAHMVTTAAFNALLKLVEEPPDFVKFVFATTEPEKVLTTIRSRTFHYPFRLMPRRDLTALLQEVVAAEGIAVEPQVLPLVVRAAAGSARDALSILDQVLASADEAGVTREAAAGLLGVTPDVLLEDVLDAFSVHDAATVFSVVDQVMEGGHDPRRFAADVLEHLRDLVVLDAVPDALDKGVLDCPPEHLQRMSRLVTAFGTAGLSRAADLFHAGLTEMRGTTAPRLLLELVCARVLLPAASAGDAAVLTRLERLERRFGIEVPDGAGPARAGSVHGGRPGPAASRASEPGRPTDRDAVGPAPDRAPVPDRVPALAAASAVPEPARPAAPSAPAAPAAARGPASGPAAGGGAAGDGAAGGGAAGGGAAGAGARQSPAGTPGSSAWPPAAVPGGPGAGGGAGGREPFSSSPTADGRGAAGPAGDRHPAATAPEEGAHPVEAAVPDADAPLADVAQGGGLDAAAVRKVWDEVLDHVKRRKRVTHARLSESQVVRVDGARLTLSFSTPTLARQFGEAGTVHVDVLREALQELLGVDLQVAAVSGDGSAAGTGGTGHAGGTGSAGGTGPTGMRAPGAPAARTAGGDTARTRDGHAGHDGFAPGDEAADDDEPAPPGRGEDAAVRLLQQALGGRVVGTIGD